MSTRPLLVDSSAPPRDERYEDLLRKYERLRDELDEAKLKVQEARNQSAKALRAQARLRSRLDPLYQALRGVMEELPEGEVEGDAPDAPQSNSKWEIQKRLFPGRPSDLIDLLMVRSGMNTTEIATALRSDPRTITKVIFILNKAGLIEKNGGRFSLKQL